MEYDLEKEVSSIEDIKLVEHNNMLLVERIHDTSKYENSKLEVVKDWSAGEHAERYFKVIKAPKTVFFDPRYPNSNSYATEMEVKEGDEIIINLSESLNTFVYSFKDKVYHTIKYDSIVCALRDGDIILVNGYVLIEPIKKSRKVIEHEIEYIVPNEGKIAHIGTRNSQYKRNYVGATTKLKPIEKQVVDWHDRDLYVGDEVVLDSTLAINGTEQGATIWPLESSAHRKLDKHYFVCQRPQIVFIKE
jgi:hypothetical protein